MTPYAVTTFSLGTSTVLTLPKKLGIPAGVRAEMKKRRSSLLVDFVDVPKENRQLELERDLTLIRKLSGGVPVTSRLTPDDMNRVYDDDIYG